MSDLRLAEKCQFRPRVNDPIANDYALINGTLRIQIKIQDNVAESSKAISE